MNLDFYKKLLEPTLIKQLKNSPITLGVSCILISTATTLIIYSIFYYFSEIIWSMYSPVDPMLLAPHVRSWIEHDGIEVYAMYALVLLSIGLTFLIFYLLQYFYEHYKIRSRVISYSAISILIICSILFLYHVGFHPPMIEIAHLKHLFLIESIVLLSLCALIGVSRLPILWSTLIITLVLIPICFLSTSAISVFDYGFVFSPALRLIHGFGVQDIYFQYDMFLSLLASAWMKLHFNLSDFRIIAQASIYGLILAEFILARRLFLKRDLSYYLLATLVLIKIYAYIVDPTYCIQLTPLRLDFWIIPFIFVVRNGAYNIMVGCSFFVMIILHRSFGFLYSLSYIQLILILFAIDFFETLNRKDSIKKLVKKHFLLVYPNLLLMMLALGVNYSLFGTLSPQSALLYQQLGIGFMRISQISFYWYVPIVLGATFLLLFVHRKTLPDVYFTSGIFIILLSLANSAYFFGRSHESNIIHISGPLFFVLFLLFDLLNKNFEPLNKDYNHINQKSFAKYLLTLMPIIFILTVTYFYSERITRNVTIHAKNIYHQKFRHPIFLNKDITDIRTITHNSDKVYVLSTLDFYYYYYGNYIPQGYFLPYASWPFKEELVKFLQDLLNKNYYIVIRKNELTPQGNELTIENEVLASLSYQHTQEDNDYKAVWG